MKLNPFLLLICLLVLAVLPLQLVAAEDNSTLPVPLWAQFEASAQAGSIDPLYHVTNQGAVYSAFNNAQDYRVTFGQTGPIFRIDDLDWGLHFAGYGFGTEALHLPSELSFGQAANRIDYQRGNLREWYVNGPNGVQQGFTINAAPLGDAEQPLTVALELVGDLLPGHMEGDSLTLIDSSGAAKLTYSGLMAFDAKGQPLEAWLGFNSGRLYLHVDARGAAYPVTIDPVVQQAKLNPQRVDIPVFSEEDDLLGYSVALSGDTALVGAYNQSTDTNAANAVANTGAAYVYTRSGTVWTLQAKLNHSNRSANDRFGFSVAISGNTAVVGAPLQDTDAGGGSTVNNAGAAYVFVRSGSTWTQQQKLVASFRVANDQYGYSVAIDGETVLVGAPYQDRNAADDGGGTVTDAGAIYVLTRTGTTWSQQQKIVAPTRQTNDNFGWSVGISGNSAIIGAPLQDRNESDSGMGGTQVTDAGAAYVWTRSGTTWTQQQKIIAPTRQANDNFGWSVGIDGNTVIMGAPLQDRNATDSGMGGTQVTNAGAAYIWTRSGSTWTQQQKLIMPTRQANDNAGWSVAISGETVLIGAPLQDRNAADGGGGQVSNAGAVYAWTRSGTTWTQQQKMVMANRQVDDNVGWSVALDSNTALMGAPNQDFDAAEANEVNNAGAAYVWTRSGSTWTQQQKLAVERFGTPSIVADAAAADTFGWTVAIDADTAIVGAYNQGTNAAGGAPLAGAGSAYVYTRSGTVWTIQAKLVASDRTANDLFGHSVAVSGDTVLIGAPYQDRNANGFSFSSDAGAAYVFVRSGSTWSQQEKLVAGDRQSNDNFGWDVALDGNTALIGSPFQDRVAGGGVPGQVSNAGAAYVFFRTGSTWSQQQKLVAANRQIDDNAGFAVAISGNSAIIGAPYQDRNAADGVGGQISNAGAAYVWTRAGTTWSQQQKLVMSDRQADDNGGYDVAIQGDTVLIGAPYHDLDTDGANTVSNAGAAYAWTRNGSTWTESHKLTSLIADRAVGDFLGMSVALSGNTALVGAPYQDTNATGGATANNAGAAYAFTLSGDTWTQLAKFVPTDRATGDIFGLAVAASGNTAIVGAPLGNGGVAGSGTAYTFLVTETPMMITQTDGSTNVIEGGPADTYSMVLASDPEEEVTVTLIFDSTQIQVNGGNSPLVLNFNSLNFNIPQIISVTAILDATIEGDHSTQIRRRVIGAGPLTVDAIPSGTVTVYITEENLPPTANDDTFSVAEDAANGTNVGTVTANDPNVTDTLSYSITAGNTDNIFAISSSTGAITVDDNSNLDFETTPQYVLTVTVTDNDTTTGGTNPLSNTATITINVTDVNEPPTITAPSNQTILEDTDTGALAVTLGDPDTALNSLTLTGVSANQALIPDANIVFAGTGANRTVTITPAANAFGGPVTITLTVDDGEFQVDATFTVTVTSVNDAPTFTASNPPTVSEDAGAQTIAAWATFSAGPANESGQTVVGYTVSNVTNGALFSVAPSVANNGTLTYTPAANAFGTSQFTVVVQDSGGTANGGVDTSAPQTFTITVLSVNDAPSFTLAGNPPTVLEDAGAQTITNFATDISAGPANEAAQVLTFNLSITGTTGGLTFSSAPAINATTGTLTYTPTANSFGTATVQVILRDNGGTANGGIDESTPQSFTITVTSVNDAPTFTASNPPTVSEDAGAQSVAAWATFSAGPANESGQTVVGYTVSNITNAALFSVAPSVANNGTLTYTPVPDAFGTSQFTVVVQDNGGTANGGVDTSAPQTFTITVLSVNDAPSFSLAGDPPTILEDAGAQTITNFATDISPGPANESAQVLTFNLIISGTTDGLTFATAPAINATTGTLTYTPTANSFGTATIQVTLSDDGGTANGGVDTSAAQSFTITVTPVNDAPTFTASNPPTVSEDAGAQSVAAWAIFSAGPANESSQTVLGYTVSNITNAALFSVAPSVANNGTLTYTPVPDAFGTSEFTVVVQDSGGTANGGVDTSAPQTFTITVLSVNDAPSFTLAGDPPTILEDAGIQSIPNFATDISAGPANEAAQVLTFDLTISGTTDGLTFATAPAINATNGTLTYTPFPDSFGTATIQVILRDDGGTANGGIDESAPQSFTITVTPVNDAPTFTAVNPPTVLEDAGAQTVVAWATFSAGPANESSQTVIGYTVSNVTNAALFSVSPSVANNGTLTYTPAANAFGTSQFTVVVQDSGGTANGGVDTSAPQTFTITITGVNDQPSFTASTPPTILEDAGLQTIAAWATFNPGPNEASQAVLAYTVSNVTNAALFSVAPAVANNGTLTYTPAPDQFGTSQFTVVVQDNGGTANGGVDTSAPQTFTITVTPVNDAPTFTAVNPPTILEDAPAQTIAGWATFSPGPANESSQTVVAYTVSNITNAALFSVTPSVANNGTLTYTPAANAFGTSQFTVRVQDSGGTANGGVDTSAPQTFTITITGVNDQPSFTASNPPTSLEDAGVQTIAGWATFNPGPNEASQTVLAYTVSNVTNAALFSAPPAVANNGTLTYTAAPDQFGTSQFTVVVRDNGGTANGGVDTSAPQTFTITVLSVNDAPTFTAANPPAVLEDSGLQIFTNWASFSPGPANESSQAVLQYLVSVSNPSLFSYQPIVWNSGTLTFTPAVNAFGTSDITVRVRDNGGTANGGVDTSAPQTFTITITGVNDQPNFTASNPPTSLEDGGLRTVAGWATFSPGPANESSQTVLSYTVSNVTNPSLFSVVPAVANNGTLTYTAAPDQFGTSQFTVVVRDNGGTANGGVDTSAPKTFTITVLSVNDAPTFTAANPPTILEDAPAQTIAAWASFSPGPANENSQTVVSYTVSNVTNPSLFSVAPSVANNGTLTYTPAPDAFGTSQFTVRVRDSGGTANGGVDTSAPQTFTITITGVNDMPTFTGGADVQSNWNAGPRTFPVWATDISAGPANEADQSLFFSVIVYHTVGALSFSQAPAIDPTTGNLTYESTLNTSGMAYVAVYLSDNGGTANGGVQTNPTPHLFTITVYEPNAYMIVEAPAPNTAGLPNTINVMGWALDAGQGAGNGPGIDLIRVYLGSSCAGTALGEAAPSIPRPEIRDIFGLDTTYTNIGFDVPLTDLPNGILTMTTCARSVIDDTYVVQNTRTVTIGNVVGALMSVEYPAQNGAVALTFNISGWAFDPTAGIGNGTGINAVRVFQSNTCAGQVVAEAILGITRPDVQAFYNLDDSYQNSGYSANVTVTGFGPRTYTICARSSVTGLYPVSMTRTVYATGWDVGLESLDLDNYTRDSLPDLQDLETLDLEGREPEDQAPIPDSR